MKQFNFKNFKMPNLPKLGQGRQKDKDPKGPWAKFFMIVASFFISLFILATLAGALLFAYYVSSAPKLTEKALTSTNSSKLYDNQNNLIADLGAEKRTNVKTEDIPVDLVNAIISIEDHRFYDHRGVDVVRIMGAVFNNLTSSKTQGGSTLTQQFIKLTFFSTSSEHQNLKRKAQEAWLSLQLERRNTKEEILTYYVNKVFMANNNYGMQTASKSYYGKDLKELSLAQLALLAGMPQAPSQYDPYSAPETAKTRRDTVLSQMLKHKYIDQAQYEAAVVTPVEDGLLPLSGSASYSDQLDNYIKEVIEEVKEKTGYNPMTTGLNIYTNVDVAAQQRLWDIYNTDTYVEYPDNDMQVASTVIDVTNGKVVAQLGARHESDTSSLGTNQAVETDRDWGSTMKPISDYAPAIENGIYNSTGAWINDAPYNYPYSTTPVYNWDKKYMGGMSIQTAIMTSRNIPAVKSLEAVGLEEAKTFLNKLGIDYPEMVYANAISSSTSDSSNKYGASSEKMAAAYAAIANGGTYYKPQYVNKIVFSDGTETSYSPEGQRAMKETTAYMMTSMMKTVLTYAAGQNAAISGLYQAGKTGTSNYGDDEIAEVMQNNPGVYSSSLVAPDENYVGYTNQYAMAVWTGYKNRKTPVLDTGLYVATDVYRSMMLYLYETTGSGATDWEVPEGLYRSGSYFNLYGRYNYNNYYPSSSTTYSSTQEASSSSLPEAPLPETSESSSDPATTEEAPAEEAETPDNEGGE